jgi:hypothetical protein
MEDHIAKLAEVIGADRILFGSAQAADVDGPAQACPARIEQQAPASAR